MTALTATAVYGFTEAGTRAHLLANPSTRKSLCGLLLDHIPLNQTGPAARCRRCDTAAAAFPHLVVAGPLEEPADDEIGVCSHCGSDEPLNLGMVIRHGVARMRGAVIVRTPEPCPGAGHAPEVDQ